MEVKIGSSMHQFRLPISHDNSKKTKQNQKHDNFRKSFLEVLIQ